MADRTRDDRFLARHHAGIKYLFAPGLLAAAIGSAYAQTAPVTSADADKKAEEKAANETITISATRRRELIREVPLAITVVPAERLAETGAKTLNDYLAAVPGVVIQNSGVTDGVGNIVIRGLTVGIDSNAPTTIYIDDVPLGLGTPFDLNLLDLRRFEVLRGPQGTLYGSSAEGGIVKYVTNAPDTSAFSGKVTLGASQTQHGGVNTLLGGVVNAPLQQDVAALRVAVYGSHDAGWVNATGPAAKDGVDKRGNEGARVSLLVTPMRDLALTLTAMTQKRTWDGGERLVYDFDTHAPAAGDLVYTQLGNPEPRTNKRELFSLSLDYDLNWARFTTVVAKQTMKDRLRTDFTPLGMAFFGAPAYIDNQVDNDKTTLEFRLVSQANGPVQWLAGAFFDKVKITSAEQDLIATGATPTQFNGSLAKRDYKESALYGNLTWNLTADLALTGGLRVAKYKQEDDARTTATPANLITFDENANTYLLTAKYRLTPQSNIYARAANGYRPGGANYSSHDPVTGNPIPGAKLSYGTDNAWTYEAGYKANLSQAASVEIAVFETDWKDLQQFTQPVGLGGVGFTSNLGKARIRGIEAGGTFKPIADLSLGVALSLLDPKLLTDSPGLGGFAGDRLPNSPKTAVGITSRYTFALAGNPAFAGLNVNYLGDRNSSFVKYAQVPNYVLPAYTQFDFSGGVRLGSYDVGVYVRNLTNKRGQIGVATSEKALSGRTYVHVIDPRTVGINLSASF